MAVRPSPIRVKRQQASHAVWTRHCAAHAARVEPQPDAHAGSPDYAAWWAELEVDSASGWDRSQLQAAIERGDHDDRLDDIIAGTWTPSL